jgi:hypothetical protein
MVSCNISSVVNVTRAVLPGMVARQVNLNYYEATENLAMLFLTGKLRTRGGKNNVKL